jgi:hypothetical protein
MAGDIFQNGGLGSLSMTQPEANPMPTPQGNGQEVVAALLKQLSGATQTTPQVRMPQMIPPNQIGPVDPSPYMVNPNTAGGPQHNATAGMISQIGNAVAGALNRHEQKQAMATAFDIQTMESAINMMNDPNVSPEQKQLAQQQLNELTSDSSKMKKIQKALGIQLFGEDKRSKADKMAAQYAKIGSLSGNKNTPPSMNITPQGMGGGGGMGNGMFPGEMGGVPQGLNPMAQQLMRRFPIQQGLSPSAMATAELTKAGVIPSASDIMKYASDQQYYQVMTEKFGAEQATKMADIQRKAEADMRKAEMDLFKAQTQNEYKDALLRMKEIHEGAYEQINNARLNLMKEQLNQAQQKIDQGATKMKRDALRSQRGVLGDMLKSETSILTKAQQMKDKGLIKSTQDKIDQIQQQQKRLNKTLETLGGNDKDDSDYGDPDTQRLIDMFNQSESGQPAKVNEPRQTL